MTENIRRTARLFRNEFEVSNVTLEDLRSVMKKQGYTIIEYNNIFNSEYVAALIKMLDLEQVCERSKGFTYADSKYRLVFLHEDLSEKEKLIVLAHEEGHIYCNHLSSSPIIGRDVVEEHEANEFSHYLLHQGVRQKIFYFLAQYRKVFAAFAIIIALLMSGCIIYNAMNQKQGDYNDFYITSAGNKYHKADCIFIKDKTTIRRMTEKEFESGEYEPCKICLP